MVGSRKSPSSLRAAFAIRKRFSWGRGRGGPRPPRLTSSPQPSPPKQCPLPESRCHNSGEKSYEADSHRVSLECPEQNSALTFHLRRAAGDEDSCDDALRARFRCEFRLGRRSDAQQLDVQVPAKLGYPLYLPKDYEQKESWPLLLCFCMDRRTRRRSELVTGLPKLIAAGKEFPFIVVSPQSEGPLVCEYETVALFDDLAAKHKVDQTVSISPG